VFARTATEDQNSHYVNDLGQAIVLFSGEARLGLFR